MTRTGLYNLPIFDLDDAARRRCHDISWIVLYHEDASGKVGAHKVLNSRFKKEVTRQELLADGYPGGPRGHSERYFLFAVKESAGTVDEALAALAKRHMPSIVYLKDFVGNVTRRRRILDDLAAGKYADNAFLTRLRNVLPSNIPSCVSEIAFVAEPTQLSFYPLLFPKKSPVRKVSGYTAVELCAGGGGQALGLEQAGFSHLACVEYEPDFCETLRTNRPAWNVICQDIRIFDGRPYCKCALLAGGVPCPPFSIAGKQLGEDDERDMFPAALRLVAEIKPRAVMLENVKGLMTDKFAAYRDRIVKTLLSLGYEIQYRLLEASDYGVPQLRPRFVLVALKSRDMNNFEWPKPLRRKVTVGNALSDLLAADGWRGAENLKAMSCNIAPTLVGGSKKHGGPDLGPTRARAAWAKLGIDGRGVVDKPPSADFPKDGMPRLTVRMAARIQGFPDKWHFYGGKTTQYRQIGNAFPPPVAKAVSLQIRKAFERTDANEK